MAIPRRLRQQTGRNALVDGVPFILPVGSADSPALMAAFPINPERAAELLPGNELHPLRIGRHAVLLVSVIDYRQTNIGKYIEYSLGIGCTHGPRPVSLLRALLFRKSCGLGQYVFDLPVSTEISVKGGKGIWGMPKHQASLDFQITETSVRSRYDLDGSMVAEVEIERPGREIFPMSASAANWCAFRGMLMKSSIFFRGKMGFRLWRKNSARLTLGQHSRADTLRRLQIGERPFFTGYFPASFGVLDDHLESWFLSYPDAPARAPEGLESVVDLGLGETWLPPPGSPGTLTKGHDASPAPPFDSGA